MRDLLKKLWPLLIGLVLFLGVSYVAQSYLAGIKSSFVGSSLTYGMALYVALGIATVIIPFGTILPVVPIAVELWGWQIAALLTALSWVLGAQMLFEFARRAGKPFMKNLLRPAHYDAISGIVQRKGFVHALIIRMVVHGDIVSYAFGLFSDIGRLEFLLVTVIGVTPGAFLYAYAGSLPIQYQVLMILAGIAAFVVYHVSLPQRAQKKEPIALLP